MCQLLAEFRSQTHSNPLSVTAAMSFCGLTFVSLSYFSQTCIAIASLLAAKRPHLSFFLNILLLFQLFQQRLTCGVCKYFSYKSGHHKAATSLSMYVFIL